MSAAPMGNVGPWICHPLAGMALMKAHNWLKQADDARGVDAFALVGFAAELHSDALGQARVVELLADVSPEQEAAMELAFVSLLLDRLRVVAEARGITLSSARLAELEQMRRSFLDRGGAA